MLKNRVIMNYKYLVLLNYLIVLVSSCANTKKTAYFFNQGTTEITSSNLGPRPAIEINDLLSINVSSLSLLATTSINSLTTGGSTNTSYNSSMVSSTGYLVAPDGYIKFPQIGRIKVVGLTPGELEDSITIKILQLQLLREPIVTVRHLNYKVTVLGEVARPAVFNVPNSKISLIEAIGMAGDMTIYGRRDNVLLIREENNKKITVRINLNSTDLFKSPYYYLKSNDVIYVEPNSAKVTGASRAKDVLPVIFSALSFTVIAMEMLTR